MVEGQGKHEQSDGQGRRLYQREKSDQFHTLADTTPKVLEAPVCLLVFLALAGSDTARPFIVGVLNVFYKLCNIPMLKLAYILSHARRFCMAALKKNTVTDLNKLT